MKRLYRLVVEWPWAILVSIFLLTAFFGYYAVRIRIDSSVESMLPQGDPERQYYEEVRRLFGRDDVGVVAIVADTIYNPETLKKIDRLTAEIRKIPEVKNALSLMNAPDPVAKVAGEENDALVPEIPATPEAWEALKQKISKRPVFVKNLVSADGRAAAINIFFLDSISDDEFIRRGVDDKVQALLASENGPEQLYYSGLPHFKATSAKAMQQDLIRLIPVALYLLMIILFFCFRSVRGVVLPTLAVVVSLIWILGIMVLYGSRLSLGTVTLPLLILVVGTAYSLHIVAEYYELVQPGRSVREIVGEAMASIGRPALVAALCTVVGFFSQVVSPIVSIQEMGVYSSIGVIITFIMALLLIPAFLMLLRPPAERQESFAPGVSAALRKLVLGDIRHRYAILIGGGILAVLAAIPIPSIEVGSNFLSVFRPNHPMSIATAAINQSLVGSLAFNVVIDGEPGSMKQWDMLRRIKDLQVFLESLPGIDKVISFVDYCEMIEKGLQAIPTEEGTPPPEEEQKSFWENPEQLEGVLQIIFLNNTSFTNVVDSNFTRSNMLVRTSLARPSEVAATVEKIRTFAGEHFPPEVKVHPTGNLILNTRTVSGLFSGEIQSLGLTVTVIFVIMSMMFLSVRMGIVAMIPNVFPIVVFFGLMGISGIVLSVSTSIIASIALGLAVDDTIHIMDRLSTEKRHAENQEQALLDTLSAVGKPALYYSLLLCLSFLSFGLSIFVPIQEFGLLSAVTILVGLAAEIIFLPALLAASPVITLWDLLYLRLGRDPHKTIPLFAGLQPFQAKIVTLMGELKMLPKGQPIIRRGEMGNEMYVLVNGTADVFIPASNGLRKVNTLGRGDVFGEMGLLRHHERTADVVAAEDVEVLSVNERFLTRIKRRYPRIATEIFFNLSKILSDRLERAEKLEG
jgi:predicted RND superfamily exporter protein